MSSKSACAEHGCDRPIRSKGLCNKHYVRARRRAGLDQSRRVCSIEGCDREHEARGLCKPHWKRWRRHGDPLAGGHRTPSAEVRAFVDSVIYDTAPREPNGCVLWPFGVDAAGYGRMWHPEENKPGRAGRVVLERIAGPAPTADHTMGHAPHEVCGHRACVAPEHLSWQTMTEQRAQQELDRQG